MLVFKSSSIYIAIILAVCMQNVASGANIMFFFGLATYSHRIAVWPLIESLADRGHNITVISPFPAKRPHPKVLDIVPKSLKTWTSASSDDRTRAFFETRRKWGLGWEWFMLPDIGFDMCSILLEDSEFLDYIRKNPADLIVIDGLFNECGYGIAWIHKAKVILLDTANPFPWFVDSIGFPDESSWVPDQTFHPKPSSSPSQDLSFWSRVIGLFNPLMFNYIKEIRYFPKLEKLIREKLSPDFPSASEVERNVSLTFVNHHFGEDYPRSLPPNLVAVGGMNCFLEKEKLPKDLEAFLNSNNDPFIYMSFGSYVEFSFFPKQTQSIFENVLSRLKNVKVVWKINHDLKEKLPGHIYTGKWMPQTTLLGHPKIRGFVSHSGLLGIHESICAGVPLIAFPVFAEQDYNADKLELRNVGIVLEITNVTENEFENALHKIIQDRTYSENMKKLSKKFLDRPSSPVDTAVWWMEYALRHENTSHLVPSSVHQSWWKKRQLDIWFCVFLILLAIIKMFFAFMKLLYKFLFKGRNNSNTKLKTN